MADHLGRHALRRKPVHPGSSVGGHDDDEDPEVHHRPIARCHQAVGRSLGPDAFGRQVRSPRPGSGQAQLAAGLRIPHVGDEGIEIGLGQQRFGELP